MEKTVLDDVLTPTSQLQLPCHASRLEEEEQMQREADPGPWIGAEFGAQLESSEWPNQ